MLYEYRTKGGLDTDKEAQVQGAVLKNSFPSTSAGSAASVMVMSLSRINGVNRRVDPDPQQDLHSKDEDEEAKLSITTSIIVLALGTEILAFNTQFMIDGISGIAYKDLSEAFIGLVLILMLSNDVTAFQNAAQDKMNSTIQCALGRSLQITLLVIPGLVLIAWIMQLHMTLSFDGFYMTILFASTLVVQAGISNGNSNW